jgi:hypothetical protein
VSFRPVALAVPILLGVVALVIWLRRRRPEPPVQPDALAPSTRAEAPTPPREPPAGRSEGAPERRPVDIVTVVDDLLGASG